MGEYRKHESFKLCCYLLKKSREICTSAKLLKSLEEICAADIQSRGSTKCVSFKDFVSTGHDGARLLIPALGR